ncbi:MAG: hypothetical protein IT376_14210 [Polyangiaceae bacterium]|nr:hypothetical protein [Polyangiaceae bacterium]
MDLLAYPAQVAELEAIQRILGARPAPPPPLAPLGPPGAGRCVVCRAERARPCSACGAVAYCGPEHHARDARWHAPACEALRRAEEDGAHCRSDPPRGEPPPAVAQAGSPLGGWVDRLGRPPDPGAPADRRSTRWLSRPLTVVSLAERLGWWRPGAATFRVHVAGATPYELEQVPAWRELTERWPETRVHLTWIGPELVGWTAPQGPERLAVSVRGGLYDPALVADLGAPDAVVAFDAGLVRYPSWERTVRAVLAARAPLVVTSYSPWELALEARLLAASGGRHLVPPGPNPFASLAPLRSSTIANAVRYENGWLAAVQGG